ncbi:hypothetical protein BASA61_002229 [Batrachochytrium salamandrivorans]|nr:hypothetical protein BASA61_002229 [Batrachochytrium salamandrivorans]KAH9256719.1 hypothetical protein BASA81_005224 [Batrachochytrium salamandrivorans]KAH9276286.1 hypothetical protein BASA83_000965 [Batrachochytrium salamandrivorans]
MKLISFAALSFLAITVSAYPGPGTPSQGAGAQGAQQPRGAGARDAEQPRNNAVQGVWQSHANAGQILQEHYQQPLYAKLNDLKDSYKARKSVAEETNTVIKVLEYEMQELGSMLVALKAGPEYEKVFKQYMRKSKEVSEQYKTLKDLEKEMKDIKRRYDRTVKEIASSS